MASDGRRPGDLLEDQRPITAHPQQPPGRRALQSLALLLPLALLAVQAWRYRSIADDGFIYLRIVRNVLAGNGPVFNAGERVETYTGPLWLAVLSLLGWARQDWLPWISVLTGIAFTLLALGLATVASSRLMRQLAPPGLLMPFGSLIFVAVGVVWTFASTGLETGLTFLWLAGCLWVLVRWAAHPVLPAWCLMVVGLGPLVRPELALSSVVFLLPVLVTSARHGGVRAAARTLLWGILIPVGYQLFRMAYFGMLVPTTAIAKEGSKPRPDWGWDYLLNFLSPYKLLFPLLIVLLVYGLLLVGRRTDRLTLALVAVPFSGVVNAGFVVLMGGDYMHGRLLLPALFAILAPVSVLPACRRMALAILVLPWAAASILVFRVTPGLTLPVVGVVGNGLVTPADSGVSTTDPPTWWHGDGLYARFALFGDFAKQDIPLAPGYPPTVMATTAIGLSAYVVPLDFYIHDNMGLANPLSAHMELTRRALAGHEKMLPTPWVAAQLSAPGTPGSDFDNPDFVLPEGPYGDLIPRTSGAALDEQTELARQALRCGALAELVDQPRRRLTPALAWQNMVRSFSMTQLRIPPDPVAARATFCATTATAP